MAIRFLMVLVASCMATAGALAQDFEDVDLNLSVCGIDPEAVEATVFTIPDGSGPSFSEAFAPGGGIVDATIFLILVGHDFEPVVGFPVEDIWLETAGGGLAICDGAVDLADIVRFTPAIGAACP